MIAHRRRKNGVKCTVQILQSTLDDEPPSVGAIITVKHNGSFSNGTLKRPVYWREARSVGKVFEQPSSAQIQH